MICSTCKKEGFNKYTTRYDNGVLKDYCPDCRARSVDPDPRINSMNEKRFMYNDKQWENDIKSRKLMPDGSVAKFKNGKRVK